MTSSSIDGADDVRATLRDIADEYGVEALDDPTRLAALLPDLLAGRPREATLVLAAARAGVIGRLRMRVDQGLTVAAAIRGTAATVEHSSLISYALCEWITTEYARIAGLPLDAPSSSGPPPPEPPTTPIPAPPTDVTRLDPGTPDGPAIPRNAVKWGAVVVAVAVVVAIIVANRPTSHNGDPTGSSSTPAGLGPSTPDPSTPGPSAPGPSAPGPAARTLAECIVGTWSVRTSYDTLKVDDVKGHLPLYSGRVVRQYFPDGTGSARWEAATFRGIIAGKAVTTVWNLTSRFTYAIEGDNVNTTFPPSSPGSIEITVDGRTTTKTSISLHSGPFRTECTDTELTRYDTTPATVLDRAGG